MSWGLRTCLSHSQGHGQFVPHEARVPPVEPGFPPAVEPGLPLVCSMCSLRAHIGSSLRCRRVSFPA